MRINVLSRLCPDESGSVIVYVALAVPALLGVCALGAEGAYRLYMHRLAQSAADMAAYSAAAAYAADSTTDYTMQARAVVASNANLLHGQDGVTIAVNKPAQGQCYSGTTHFTGANTFEVVVSRVMTPMMSAIFDNNNSTICGRAVAFLPPTGDCVLALGASGTTVNVTKNGLTIDLKGCGVFSNSDSGSAIALNGNSDLIKADMVGAVGGIALNGNNKTTVFNPVEGAPPVADPYATAASSWPRTGGTDHTSDCPAASQGQGKGKGQTIAGCKKATLDPGIYTAGMIFDNRFAAYTLNPGVYYVSGGDFRMASSNISVTGNGVTIVMADNHIVSVKDSTNSTLSITAPTAGWNAGIAIWEPLTTGTNIISENNFNANIVGVIYAPLAAVQYGGNNGVAYQCTQIVASTIEFNGNSINITGDCGGVAGMKTFGQIPALVE